MKRSQFLRYGAASALTTLGLSSVLSSLTTPAIAQGRGTLTVQWLGHTCFLFTGGGQRVLVNPFRQIGCTAGYRAPRAQADYVLISSRLLDEGVPEGLPGNPRILFEAGSYTVDGRQFNGVSIAHDRLGGRRFGTNVIWKWQQAGINVVHLGGAAGQIEIDQRILLNSPPVDVLLVPVGGGPKAYNAQEAATAVQILAPKIVIPTHYRTAAADPVACDIDDLEPFLAQFSPEQIRRVGSDTVAIAGNTLGASGTRIFVMNYAF